MPMKPGGRIVRPRLSSSVRAVRSVVLSIFLAAVIAAGLRAATPTFWTVSTQADFLKGDVENLSIDSDGRVFPGPAASVLARCPTATAC